MISDKELLKIINFCDKNLQLNNIKLSREFYYSSLPLCVIDAVFSIGIKYSAVINVINRYCYNFSIETERSDRMLLPDIKKQQSIKTLISLYDEFGLEFMTNKIFKNKNRTSPKNGILKSEAVYYFAQVLHKYDVNFFQDINKIKNSESFKKDILSIAGQGSGTSLQYFFMLAGDSNFVFPSRNLIAFFYFILQKNISPEKSIDLLQDCCKILRKTYPDLTLRQLDYAIYEYMQNSK